MRGWVVVVVAAAAALLMANIAEGRMLYWTNPSQNATVIDTTLFDCEGGPPLTDLDRVEIWGWPMFGGEPRVVVVKLATGREGKPDSADVVDAGGWHFYAVPIDHSGNRACVTRTIDVGAPTTGVSVEDRDPVVARIWFGVNGRRVEGDVERAASGVYFPIEVHRSGVRTKGKKRVILK